MIVPAGPARVTSLRRPVSRRICPHSRSATRALALMFARRSLCLDPLQLSLDPHHGSFALVAITFGLYGVVADDEPGVAGAVNADMFDAQAVATRPGSGLGETGPPRPGRRQAIPKVALGLVADRLADRQLAAS